MAKRQNFVVGSTNPVTVTKTQAQLNNGWNKYEVLKAGDLDGVFNAVSDYSNDSSQEIWNAIRILKGSNPTGASTSELGNIISTVLGAKATKATDFMTPLTSNNKGATAADLNTLREEIETSSLTFKGYVSTSAPSSSTYGLVEGNIWINASAMPTTFPVSASSIRVWNGTSWATTTDTYTAKGFDFFRNINDGEGYYWFGGQWTVMSTDMSTTYFTLNQTSGKWEIKSSVNLPGAPTTTTPAAGNSSTRIATTAFVANNFAKLASPDFTGTPTAPTAATTDDSTKIATTAFVKNVLEGYIPTGGAANTSLSNLADAGKNISNWSSNVTNCIKSITKKLNFGISAGTLILKSGSTVYVPNGTDVFDAITTTSDLTISSVGSGSTNILIFYNSGSLMARPVSDCFSGDSQPTVSTTTAEWYDTANNVIKHTADTGSTWTTPGISFPVCECSCSSGTLTEIVKTFEGFGYIGSTVFALPGITVSMPHGRTSSDLLDSTEYTTTTVSISSESYNETAYNLNIGLGPDGISLYYYSYSEMFNIVDNGSIAIVGNADFVGGKVTRFCTNYPFRAVDYSDRRFIAHQAMPSRNYIDLTLGSSGDTYTAPADGYLTLAKTADDSNQYVSLRNVSTNHCTNCYVPNRGLVGRVNIPVSKGDGINIVYTTGGDTTVFRFIYANGNSIK